MRRTLKDILFQDRPLSLLLIIKDEKTLSQCSFEMKSTSAHISKLCHELKAFGIILLKERDKRSYIIEVTEKGLVLRERAPGVSVEDIKKATAAKLTIPDDVPQMRF